MARNLLLAFNALMAVDGFLLEHNGREHTAVVAMADAAADRVSQAITPYSRLAAAETTTFVKLPLLLGSGGGVVGAGTGMAASKLGL